MKNFKINITKNEKFGGVELSICGNPKEKTTESNNIVIKILMGVAIGFVNGFWGGGGGMVCVPILMHILKLPEKKAHATTLLVMLPLSLASLIIYVIKKNMLWVESIKIGVGFVIGGVLGAIILKKISNVWLGIIFSIIIIIGGVKLLI